MKANYMIAVTMAGFLLVSGKVLAQKPTTNAQPTAYYDAETTARLKQLAAQANAINDQLKQQAAKLNKVYRDVSVEVEEELNNREDSIYLTILSEKRNVELEIMEVKKAAKEKRLKLQPPQSQPKVQPNAAKPKPKTLVLPLRKKKHKMKKY